MIHFEVSAPGRLSLFGEHVVKHGKTGLIAGIDLRTTLTFQSLSASDNILQINFPQIDLCLLKPLETFVTFYNNCIKNMRSLREQVLHFADYPYKSANHKMIVQAFYYLLVLIIHEEQIKIKSFLINISTEFMIDDDFACPASFTVCLATSLVHWSRLQKDIFKVFDNIFFEKIKSYAARCKEICSESGILDVTVCTYGSIIKYQKEEIIDEISFHGIPSMTILIVDTKGKQNLELQTQQVTQLKNVLPEIVDNIFNTIDIITKSAYNALQELCNIYQNSVRSTQWRNDYIFEKHNVLKCSIRMNQNLLRALNVPSYSLDAVCFIAQHHGMCGKYTDIGNGRYAYVWCPRHIDDESCSHIESLSNEMKTYDFNVTKTNLARSGIEINVIQNNI